jgi:hypothetical protein
MTANAYQLNSLILIITVQILSSSTAYTVHGDGSTDLRLDTSTKLKMVNYG